MKNSFRFDIDNSERGIFKQKNYCIIMDGIVKIRQSRADDVEKFGMPGCLPYQFGQRPKSGRRWTATPWAY